MSEDGQQMEETEVHYVYGDQEFIVEQDEITPELRDLIFGDGSRAILVDGQYVVADSQAILLQEGENSNLTQFYINDNNEFVVDGESSLSNLYDGTECEIIYCTNDEGEEEVTPVQDLREETDVEGIEDEDGNIYPFKRIKLEGQMLNFDEFVQKQGGLIDDEQGNGSNHRIEYTLLDDDETPFEPAPDDSSSHETGEEPPNSQVIDLSKITGRNLITGQTVTLHSYMEKLKKRLDRASHSPRKSHSKKTYEDDVSVAKRPDELLDLLDKKISIGKTKSGKKIVGKIIHVERKGGTVNEEVEEEEVREAPVEVRRVDEQTRILVKKYSVSMEGFEQISKTLGGVMEMESVRRKLENKNIVVKLVEKRYSSETDGYVRNTSYCYGYMEKEVGQVGEEEVEKWKFMPDQDTQDVLLGEHFGDEERTLEKKSTKFPITTSLTILFSIEKGGYKTIRVNLNPAPGNLCTICAQYFKSNLQLRHHMQMVHNTYGNSIMCEICDRTFDDLNKLVEHRNIHVQEGKLFICSECNKCFTSQSKMQKHQPTHDLYLRPLECSVCEVRCGSEWALKKHLLTHTGIKPFACDICGKQFMTQYDVNFHKKIHFPEKHFACNICLRTFSRHSNLLRHTEIHKGTGALYKCDICYCSYNYISSLTRHMVQNHIDAAEFQQKDEKA